MTLHRNDNPYPGINAHLNSLLQTPGTPGQPALWHSFHSQHIINMVEALNRQLPRHYIAIGEQSLQSRSEELLKHHMAVVIREVRPQRVPGNIVTRIELLSPPGSSHLRAYEEKRMEAIQTGIPLIEIDYLHETPSPVLALPVYPADGKAYPFSIVVSDPRPEWEEGRVKVYGFGIQQPLRPALLPLAGEEQLRFELNEVYRHTFESGRWGDLVDYDQEPERMDTYRAEDQTYIRKVMAQVRQS